MRRGLYLHPGCQLPKTSSQQTALPWMPGSHAGYKIPVRTSCNIEPPDRILGHTARTVQLPTSYPLIFEDCLQSSYIRSVLLHELDVKSRGRIPRDTALRIKVASRICEALLTVRERELPRQPLGRRLENPKPAGPALAIHPSL